MLTADDILWIELTAMHRVRSSVHSETKPDVHQVKSTSIAPVQQASPSTKSKKGKNETYLPAWLEALASNQKDPRQLLAWVLHHYLDPPK